MAGKRWAWRALLVLVVGSLLPAARAQEPTAEGDPKPAARAEEPKADGDAKSADGEAKSADPADPAAKPQCEERIQGVYLPAPSLEVKFDPSTPPSPCPGGYYSHLSYWAPELQSLIESHRGASVSVYANPVTWVPKPGYPPAPFYFNPRSMNLVDNPQEFPPTPSAPAHPTSLPPELPVAPK